jgi:hypothetical protein
VNALIGDDVLIRDLRARVQVAPRQAMWKGDKCEPHECATAEQLALVESQLGFAVPPLLRRIFEEVTDGGFGPAHGIFPIASHYAEAGQDETAVGVRDKLAVDPRWPSLPLPLCDWGCANWSCLDCRTESGPVVTLAGEQGFFNTGRDLRSWLSAWLSGIDLWEEMFEPRTTMGINPFTRQPIEIKGRGKPKGVRWP